MVNHNKSTSAFPSIRREKPRLMAQLAELSVGTHCCVPYNRRLFLIQWKPRIADTDNADSRIFRTTGQGRNFLLLKSAV